ncbi:MAG: hypothetical protein AB7K24_15835 [Gemmataceae bacterium]
MNQRKMLWIGVLMLSSVLGCQNRRQQCVSCCWECATPVQTVVVTQPLPDPVAAAPEVGDTEESEPIANVSITAVAPGMHEGTQTSGTVVFTPKEAKTLGIKPGVTPTALWVPSRANSEMVATDQ